MKFSSVPIFGMTVAASFAAHPALDSARRALGERIPEVAIVELSQAMKGADFPAEELRAGRLLLAEAQMRTGKPEEALGTLKSLAGPDAALLRAHSYAAAGRWSEALAQYEEVAQSEGAPLSARVGMAEALQVLGRTPEAVDAFEKLIAEGIASPVVRLRHAALLVELGQKSAAEELLREIPVSTTSEGKWRDYVAARFLLAGEQWQAGLEALDRIVATPEGLSPNLHAAIVLAATEARLKLPAFGSDTAARELEKFLWKQPGNPAIEMIFRRLDQINAAERNPLETQLHEMAQDRAEPEKRRRAALAKFYVCRMQGRSKELTKRQDAENGVLNFVEWFPEDPLTTYVHELHADLAQARGAFDVATEALKAAQSSTQDKERGAFLEMRMGMNSFMKGDAAQAATSFQLAAEHSTKLRKNAIFNSALAELGRKNISGFNARLAEFSTNYAGDPLAGELILESGFLHARQQDAAAPEPLRAFLASYPGHPRSGEAHLVLAELALADGDVGIAEAELGNATATERSDETGGQKERNRYAAIFAADAVTPRDEKVVARVIELAAAFIKENPGSSLIADVRMKLGQTYFHKGDLVNAATQFETLAGENPDGNYAEAALFLAGQCAVSLIGMDANYAERAKKLFDQVVERKGPLKFHARFQQGLVEHELQHDATAIFQSILDAQPPAPPEIRHATLCAKGENLERLAKNAPEKLDAAVEAYKQLAAIPGISAEWRNRASYKHGKILIQLGREQEALLVYNRLLDTQGAGGTETFWLYKAGFEAASILRRMGSWRGAFGIYEKLAKIPGPRAAEATENVKELRLQKFIWD